MSSESNTLDEAADLVVKHFLAGWGATSTVLLEGETEPAPGTEWCRATIRHRFAGQETLGKRGSRRYERRAAFIVQLFVPENRGSKLLSQRMQQCLTLFEGERITGSSIHFGDVRPEERGQDRKWLAANVEVEFTYTERK